MRKIETALEFHLESNLHLSPFKVSKDIFIRLKLNIYKGILSLSMFLKW